ncbi:MAG: glycosyltransferase, partial [Thermoplasmata archaeon]
MIFGVGYPILLAYVIVSDRGRSKEEGDATEHVFSLLVPALNEEEVIEATLDAILNLDYPEGKFEVVVIDDGSNDETSAIVRDFVSRHPGQVRLQSIPVAASRRGKASALNAGYAHLRESSPFRNETSWIIGIFDADGRPDADMLQKVSHQFIDPAVGGVQSSVRIRNSGATWIAR